MLTSSDHCAQFKTLFDHWDGGSDNRNFANCSWKVNSYIAHVRLYSCMYVYILSCVNVTVWNGREWSGSRGARRTPCSKPQSQRCGRGHHSTTCSIHTAIHMWHTHTQHTHSIHMQRIRSIHMQHTNMAYTQHTCIHTCMHTSMNTHAAYMHTDMLHTCSIHTCYMHAACMHAT